MKTSPIFKSEAHAEISLEEQCQNFMKEDDSKGSSLLDFLRVICLCHDITKVTDQSGKTFLTGPSQDELCLVKMAAQTGLCEFIDRNSAVLTIKVNGELEEYKNIKFYDFTSARRMMTRVVQNVETG